LQQPGWKISYPAHDVIPWPHIEPSHTGLPRSKVAVFSKTYCPYCTKAKRALAQYLKPQDIFVMELDQRGDGDDIQVRVQQYAFTHSGGLWLVPI
jgi:hypothetical protein